MRPVAVQMLMLMQAVMTVAVRLRRESSPLGLRGRATPKPYVRVRCRVHSARIVDGAPARSSEPRDPVGGDRIAAQDPDRLRLAAQGLDRLGHGGVALVALEVAEEHVAPESLAQRPGLDSRQVDLAWGNCGPPPPKGAGGGGPERENPGVVGNA